ncbi:hypothetical protein [Chitinophaga eiseniae]|uniref:Uncharacterized protein n=1 Tax=Chitinophaga eiseniae TaxID=634771 RepID=A0A847SAW5_9BACT|nr:hypothetical protein [Chitinophaga eiseniae]NLR80350.1 hypothetical protein [Chitinophaga eiseniae]
MKWFLIICIFLGLLLQNFSKSLIVVQFQVNQAFIARELCENRNKPQMHCNGRCHLKKELDRDARQEKNNNTGKNKYEVMFVETIHAFTSTTPKNNINVTPFYKDPYLDTFTIAIFHPPQSVVA